MSCAKNFSAISRSAGCLSLAIAATLNTGGALAACHVNASAVATGDGKSWKTAYRDLQDALADTDCSEIWVASGIYTPSSTDIEATFSIPPGVAVYGGFAGNESQRESRDVAANLTILSGDLSHDDANENGVDASADSIKDANSRHVVSMIGKPGATIGPATVLDGFTITGGNANGNDIASGSGGGLYCFGEGANNVCNPTLSHLVFSGNSATQGGGALFNDGIGGESNPSLGSVFFVANHADHGGAMAIVGANSGRGDPKLNAVTFADNTSANGGGAIFIDATNGESSPEIVNATFSDNATTHVGGGAIDGIASSSGISQLSLNNVTFENNGAGDGNGSAIVVDANSNANVAVTITNSILWDANSNSNATEVVNKNGAHTTIDHAIMSGGCPSNADCTSLVAGDPKLEPLDFYLSDIPVLRPTPDSAAVGAGDDATCAPSDARGIVRPQWRQCDIGAVELRSAADDWIDAPEF